MCTDGCVIPQKEVGIKYYSVMLKQDPLLITSAAIYSNRDVLQTELCYISHSTL